MRADDAVEEAVDEADLEEAAEQIEEADEDRRFEDNLPFWLWLACVFGGITLAGAGAVYLGVVEIGAITITAGEVDLSNQIQTLITALVWVFIGVTVIAALVVAPGEYLSAIAAAADGAAGNRSTEEGEEQ